MTSPGQHKEWILSQLTAIAALVLATAFMIVIATQPAQAQTFTVLHNFTGGQDGAGPYAGVTVDRGGNLYGTAIGGGCGYGTGFKITDKNGGWLFNPLYCFAGGNDGNAPLARVVFGPDGSLYGSTQFGGGDGCYEGFGCGTVFNLKPSPTACKAALCPWTETVLYRFSGGGDGAYPSYGDLIFDQAGDIYGTARSGGASGCGGNGCGVVFKLTPSAGGQYTESTVYSFTSGQDGAEPVGGLILEAGNLYGTTLAAGIYGGGTVFELVPSGSSWAEATLYSFNPSAGNGYSSAGGLIFDGSGNLYGTNIAGGVQGGGTVFELTPLNGSWTLNTLHNFTGAANCGPVGTLVMDGAGNLYDTTLCDGANGLGNVFELTPSNGSWTYTSLHDFTGGSDGAKPYCSVSFDSSGNLYGTASAGGSHTVGVVWEITP